MSLRDEKKIKHKNSCKRLKEKNNIKKKKEKQNRFLNK